MRTIEVIVSPTGASQVKTIGFAGASCKQASAFLETALGQRTQEQLTTEFYQTTPTEQQVEQDSR